ncbi:hypothetical protein YTPLAS18_03520 [Nitrospira sp.]|nr:hypothetical protein YTPLAS18_03520 [Nitrospira sp.]
MEQQCVLTHERRFSAEFKRGAVARLDTPEGMMSQIAAEVRADTLGYIDRCHNPSDSGEDWGGQQQGTKLLAHVSVEPG